MTAMTRTKHPFDVLANLRGAPVSILSALWTVVMSFVILLTIVLVRHRRVVDFMIDWVWAWPIILLSGVKVETRGLEHVRRDGPGRLLIFNHASFFDILVLYAYYPRTFRFGAKIELFKIPVFGTAMRLAGVLPIDRRNRTEVMRVYEAAVARVQAGESFALAPEGTRQTEAKLGSFKRGPFEFAINAHADLQPVVIAGAFEVLPPGAWLINRGRWRRRVILDILAPIETAGLTLDAAARLQHEAQQSMARALDDARRSI